MPDEDIAQIYGLLREMQQYNAKQSEDIGIIKTKVEAIESEKLTNRLTTLEANQLSCPAREAFRGGAKRQSVSNLIATAALIVSAVSVVVLLLAT